MDELDMDMLITAIVTAGLIASGSRRAAKAVATNFLDVQKSLYEAGVIDTPPREPRR